MQTPNSGAPAPTKRVRRVYKGTDAQMLTACLVLTDNLIPVQPDLAARRSRLTPQYLTDTRKLITDAIEQKLGLNPRTLIQQLTGQLNTTQAEVLGKLRSFNLDLRDAFSGSPNKARYQQLRALLGLADHYTAAQALNQPALTELVAKFCAATEDPKLRAELEDDLDISPKLIDDIRAHKGFYELDAAQEQGKSTVPVITDETITEFNAIYRRVQAAARLAQDLYKEDPARAGQFSFALVRRRMTGGASKPDSGSANPPTA